MLKRISASIASFLSAGVSPSLIDQAIQPLEKEVRVYQRSANALLNSPEMDTYAQAKDMIGVFLDYDWQPRIDLSDERFELFKALLQKGTSGTLNSEEAMTFSRLVSLEHEHHLLCDIVHLLDAGKEE
jgi:hypothetical protein